MSGTGRFTLGIFCGSVVFFLLTGVQFARQQSFERQARPVSHIQGGKKAEKKKTDEYHSPLIRVLSKLVEKAQDLDGGDKDSALDILRKADPLLKKIKEENRRALKRINTPVKIRGRSSRPKRDKAVEIRSAI